MNPSNTCVAIMLGMIIAGWGLLFLGLRREARREKQEQAKAQEQHDLDRLNVEYKRLIQSNGQR